MELLALGKGLEAILTQPVVKGRHRGGGGGGRLETERERGKMRGMLGEPPWLLFFSDQGQRTLGPHHTPVTTHNSSRPRKWDETLVWPTFHHEWTETSYPWLCGLVGVWERQEEKCVFFWYAFTCEDTKTGIVRKLVRTARKGIFRFKIYFGVEIRISVKLEAYRKWTRSMWRVNNTWKPVGVC